MTIRDKNLKKGTAMQTMEKVLLTKFIREVEKEAEEAMLKPPHKLEGQHYAAMKRVARRMGIELWEDTQ